MAAAPDSWQTKAIEELTAALESDAGVRALAVIGSYAQPEVGLDAWSDLDLVLVVDDREMARFYPATDWMDCLGETYARSLSQGKFLSTMRVYFVDGRRVDVVVVPESALDCIHDWEFNPFRYGARSLFSRSAAADRALETAWPPLVPEPPSPADFARMSDEFWFKAMLAASKVARDDLLVGLHLSLDMVRDCCVLGMMIRDRETGTDHHRDGSGAESFVREMAGTSHAYTARGILVSIEQSSIIFDGLAAQWSEDYEPKRHPLLRWIERVRRSLPEES
jgi:predicted nucleotidyltransferase